MKLFDVLKEDALRSFAGNRNINVYVGPDSKDQELMYRSKIYYHHDR